LKLYRPSHCVLGSAAERVYHDEMPTFERCVVLVADDEPTVLQLAARALRRHGYEVIAATDGLNACRIAETHAGPIHLAVLDVVMPGLTGPEVYQRLKEVRPKADVLFMSGYHPGQLSGMPAAPFLPKPFLPRTLVERVNQILGNEDVCVLLDDEMETASAS
jgi:two-component system cell cycle sensor histidine kinase/response regulator CckA